MKKKRALTFFLRSPKMKNKTAFEELPPEKLRWRLEPEAIPYTSTDDCEPCAEIIGQKRALKAIQTGLEIKSLGYNIFITGMVGTGRTTAIKQPLEKLEKEEETPEDILYVNNFKNPDEPSLIMLASGQGRLFKDALESLIEMIRVNIPELLKSKYYTDKREGLIEGQQAKQKEMLQRFEEKAAHQGFSMVQIQMGIFDKLREIDEETRTLLKGWDAEAITPIIKGGITGIREKFPPSTISEYL